MNKRTNEIKHFIVHRDNILHGKFNEDTKMYFDISKTESIKDLIEVIKDNLIKLYEKQDYNTKEDIENHKKQFEINGNILQPITKGTDNV